MKKIVLSNQKGGVGKTTCTRELGIFLADKGYKTLIIDTDPQANLSKSLVETPGFGLYEALTGADYEAEEVKPNLFLLAGNVKLAGLEKALIGELDAHTRLKELLEGEAFQTFDFILIDSPPSLSILTTNALTASDFLIIPMNPSLYSMQGTTDLIGTMAKVKKNLNPNLSILGVIINAYDANPVIIRQIRDEIFEAFGEKVFQTALSKSIRIEEAIASKTGVISRPRVDGRPSKAAEEVRALGEELLSRLDGR
jgi:chromosome partitioning protein